MNTLFKNNSCGLPYFVIRQGISSPKPMLPRTFHQYYNPRCASVVSLGSRHNFNANNFQLVNLNVRKLHLRSGSSFFRVSESSKGFYKLHSRNFNKDSGNGNKGQQSIIWVAATVSAGLAGVALYKFYSSDTRETSELEHSEKPKVQEIFKYPLSSKDIPENVPYLLIGGGTAAFSAFRAIKAIDSTAKILMITDEPHYPYMRPPLSKELIHNKNKDKAKTMSFTQWDGSERSIYYEPNEFYVSCEELIDSETGGISVIRGWKVTQLNPDLKYVVLEDGKKINYNKCLLATGATPKNLPVFSNSSPEVRNKVTLYRYLEDFINLEQLIEKGTKSITIVGGGFNGSELACSLARRGLEVSQIYKEDGNMAQTLPDYLSNWVTSKIQEQGVKLYKNAEVKDVKIVGNKLQLTTNSNDTILTEHVIVAAGVKPNTDLASDAGLEIDESFGGYLVNAELQARKDLYVAGDCACFYDKQLGRRRVEHHDHAVVSGRLAGENMTGAGKPFIHQSMFWSDLGPGMSYEAIGIVDSSLPTVSVYLKGPTGKLTHHDNSNEDLSSEPELAKDSKENFHKGIIFYLRNDKVVGMLMLNLFNRIALARQILKSNIGMGDLTEAAKLFSLSGDQTDKTSE